MQLTNAATHGIWLMATLMLATSVAGQAANTTSANKSNNLVDIRNVAQRVYNPPEDKYTLYKLRQWTQKNEDKAWCVSSKSAENIGETTLGLQEEECTLTSASQQINYWEVVENSHVYMLRFTQPQLCLSVRRGIDNFHAPLVPTASTTMAHLQRRAGTTPDANKSIGMVGVNATITANAPTTATSKNASADGTAVQVTPNGYPVMLNPCTGSDNQLFQMKVFTHLGHASNYYQIMSYQYKACLASERKDKAQLTLVPCIENHPSQLWMFEEVKNTIKAMDSTSTMLDYANTFQIKDFIARLGLSRDRPVRGLTEDERVRIQQTLPDALEVFDMAFQLADMVHIYANSIGDYQRAAAVLVSDLVRIFLTPDNRPAAWEKMWGIASIILTFLPIPGLLGFIKGGAQMVGDYVANEARENRRNQGPTPTELEQWNTYALNQVDFTSNLLYRMFEEVFQKARIGQLREELANFKAGKYTISSESYYKNFQVKFSQTILSAKPGQFWVSVCASPNVQYCKGSWARSDLKDHNRVYNDVYSSNLSTDALDFLEKNMQEIGNFYEGKNGWNTIDRRLYTCPNGYCRERLILRSGSNKFEVVS
ncbi:hypothetical protein SYNPS1DRAFT_29914 [Syncephalis pseudoplumigaleata]|uniref:Ricin B lectin domain-containing protein n=1 Tax=Syncephalis pseudoplumigaleata TaxID=1712513 RepID=A0A4P9YZ62_9FUNG|nr:hypothetical protein SYNPS1DRAFT_29914 [Syncephalis pseudoplumigaleata]|eukprot:RKP24320.1 hypothetical protein SYNPS1DRAFT_29914 [Syncephalis pseudoplumigaleata]